MVDERDIKSLNSLYLLVAQNTARKNLDVAQQITGFSRPILERLASLSFSEIEWLNSEMNFILFKPRISELAFKKFLDIPSGSRGSFLSSTLRSDCRQLPTTSVNTAPKEDLLRGVGGGL